MYKITVERIKVRMGSQVKVIEIPIAVQIPDKKKDYEKVPVPEWFKKGLLLKTT